MQHTPRKPWQHFPSSVHGDSSPPWFTLLSVEKGPRQSYQIKVAQISSIFGPFQGTLPFLGWSPDRGFSRLAPTAPLGTLHREGSWQRQGRNTAQKPTRPSGTSSALERECLTGGAAGSADQPTQGAPQEVLQLGFLAGHHSLVTMPAHWWTGRNLEHAWQSSADLFQLSQLFFPGLWNSVFCSKQLS